MVIVTRVALLVLNIICALTCHIRVFLSSLVLNQSHYSALKPFDVK